MKRFIEIIILTIIILTLSILLGPLSKMKYDNLVIDEDTWNNIISDRIYTKVSFINNLKFNNYDLILDGDTYYYSVTSYKPKIDYKSNYDVKVAFKNYINDELIKNNESLEMLIYTNNEYNIINIKCTTLPILSITYEDEITKEEYINMKISLFDNSKGLVDRLISSDGLIRYKGASTMVYPKKGYRINLRKDGNPNHISLLGLRKDDDYILYAAYNDPEKIRNVFSSKLWYETRYDNIFNLSNGMEYKYVELFINNEYNGLYALGYPIDNKTLNIRDNEYMFKKTTWDNSESTVIYDNDMLGYVLQDNSDEYSYIYLKEYYKKLLYGNAIDTIYSISDINNAIDMFLFNNLVQARDNGNKYNLKNIYISFKNYNGNLVSIYTPWDLDLTFGNTSSLDNNLTSIYELTPDVNIIMKINPAYILKRLGDTYINKLIYERYTYLRNTVWSNTNIKKILSGYENDIFLSGAYLRDKETWPDGNYTNNYNLKEFTNYVILRLKYMDEYIENEIGYSKRK